MDGRRSRSGGPLRVLALHGYGGTFGSRLGTCALENLKAELRMRSMEVEFVAPLAQNRVGEDPAWLAGDQAPLGRYVGFELTNRRLAERGQDSEPEPLLPTELPARLSEAECIWQGSEGAAQSLAYLVEDWCARPFDGLLGFSQGCLTAAMLCTRLQMLQESMPWLQLPQFAILCGGFALPCPQGVDTLWPPPSPLEIPSLHAIGELDTIVAPVRSEELAAHFAAPQIFRHRLVGHPRGFGGHVVPWDSEGVQGESFADAVAQLVRPSLHARAGTSQAQAAGSSQAQDRGCHRKYLLMEGECKSAASQANSSEEQFPPVKKAKGGHGKKRVLVIGDMQKDYDIKANVELYGEVRSPYANEISNYVPIINRIRQSASWDRIVFTLDWLSAEQVAGRTAFCLEGSAGVELLSGLHVCKQTDVVFKKNRDDSFCSEGGVAEEKTGCSRLVDVLDSLGLSAADACLYFVGQRFERCILKTVIHAVDLGYDSYIIDEAVYTKDHEPDPEWSVQSEKVEQDGSDTSIRAADIYCAKKSAGRRLAEQYLRQFGVHILPSWS